MAHKIAPHEHEIILGRPHTEAAKYTPRSDQSSHLHRFWNGNPEPAKVYGRWHTHRIAEGRRATGDTLEIGRLL